MTAFIFTESALLTPDVFESPELKRVRFVAVDTIPVMPSVVFDSDNERMCLAFFCICDGSVPTGSVLDRCVDVVMFSDSSRF
jgi:hypothetical protein